MSWKFVSIFALTTIKLSTGFMTTKDQIRTYYLETIGKIPFGTIIIAE